LVLAYLFIVAYTCCFVPFTVSWILRLGCIFSKSLILCWALHGIWHLA
jgi:hypothetical protein